MYATDKRERGAPIQGVGLVEEFDRSHSTCVEEKAGFALGLTLRAFQKSKRVVRSPIAGLLPGM
jgi:hypothetical protein